MAHRDIIASSAAISGSTALDQLSGSAKDELTAKIKAAAEAAAAASGSTKYDFSNSCG
ncbi:hypothetical protein [Ruminococcus sp. HUN007]|uniref:hypothetical protein n=1 Tax=Ruminococcus sp. HUN007 TaxID=1514668 RepID=UPI0012DE687A|nr:hypothetical protein [Ruminococcus sp. HUN007]